MLKLTVSAEEYIMIGKDIKIIFLGGSANNQRIMIDAPKDVNIARSKAIEKRVTDPEEKEKLPKYYSEAKKKYDKKRAMGHSKVSAWFPDEKQDEK